MRANYPINEATLDGFKMMPIKEGKIPLAGFSAKISKQKEASKMGNRLFIDPSKYMLKPFNKITAEKRKAKIRVTAGFQQIDTLNYQLPENFSIERKLKDYQIETEFGSYTRTSIFINDRVQVLRHLTFKKGMYSKSRYEEFKDFLNSVLKMDKEKMVLVKE